MANSINPFIDLNVLKSISKLLSSDSLSSQIYQDLNLLTNQNSAKSTLNSQQDTLVNAASLPNTYPLPQNISTASLSKNTNIAPVSFGTSSVSSLSTVSTTTPTPIAPSSSTSLSLTASSNYRVEAESIANRGNFRLEAIAAASGGQGLSFKDGVSSSETGTATFQFTGVDGYYDIVLGAFDENDGQARFEISRNGSLLGAVTLDQQLGSADPVAQTAVARTISSKVFIKNGDTFSITGYENAGEKARFDYLDFISANIAPSAVNDSATTTQNQALTLLASNLLANDTDANGDSLSLTSVKNAVNGTVALNTSGNPVFTPAANFTGTGSFEYVVSDGRGGTATATVNVAVNPVAASKYRVEAESIANRGNFRLEAIAAASGGQGLSFKDGFSNSETGTATFQFTGVDGYYNVVLGAFDENDGQARFEVSRNGSLLGSATLDQQLGSADPLAQTAVARTITTKLFVKNGDTFTVTGYENLGEKARFDYLDFLPTTVSVNTPPVAMTDSATTTQNQALTLLASTLLANDTDADGDKLTLSSVKNAINGSVLLNANGNPIFTPTTNFTGNASFDYVVSDGRGGTATATVKVLVNTSSTPTQTLPDLGTKFAPVSNPTLKTGSDIFAPSFLVADSGGSSRPAIAEWTRSGKGGDTIILTGWQLDSSTKFYLYGQTTATNGALLEAKIQKLDGNMAAITLPSGLPQGSEYLLWAKNSSGYSQPVVINQTETWWIKDTASRGQTASIFGRNLSQDGGTLSSQVYIEDSTGKGSWAQVVTVNPYKVDFKIPDTLANGTYKVYVHNGDGGQYGWSKPLTMTINNGLNYTGTIFNVKNYGAKGDGISNDTAAIKAALAAADQTPWATVYLPAGTYIVNEALWTGKDQVRWLGDGKDTTTIKAANGSTQNYVFIADSINNVTFQNLTLNTNSANAKNIQNGLHVRHSSDLQFLNIKINAEGTNPFDWHANNRVIMQNSDVIGQTNFLGTANQVFIDRTKFYGTGYADAMISAFGAQNLSITNSVAQNLDTSNINNGKWSKGRFFVDFAAWGIAQNQYFGNNQTIDLAPPAATGVDTNSGEQILWEPPWLTTASLGSATATTANTVRVSTPSSKVNDSYMVAIIGGKGIGQSRRVKSFDAATGTYTLYDNWNVQPDQSSLIVANRNVSNAVVYGNSLDGLSDYQTRYTASAGVQPYFGSSNLIIDSNNFNQLRAGVNLWAGWEIADRNPILFTQVTNNTFTDDLTGISMRSSGKLGTTILGNLIQNNKFSNIGTVFAMNQMNDGSGNPYPSANMNVFDRNTLGSGIGKAINLNQGNGYFANDIFLNNTWSQANINLGVTNGNLSI